VKARLTGHLNRHARSAPPTVTVSSVDDLRAMIREVPDFPKPGIRFYDITTLLKQGDAFREVIDRMADQIGDTKVDVVVGMESRGFIFSAPLAYKLGAGFVPVRKLGKLPAETIEVEYELEYGTATLEIHSDAIGKGQNVLIVDDLLATGGTVMGTIELVRRLGGEIAGLSFMVELTALHGRDKLGEFEIHTLISY
jgi:adenine phosphoribosyltransferase